MVTASHPAGDRGPHFGGKFGGFPNYSKPNLPSQMNQQHLELALRYCLGLPGVAAVNIGPHDADQLRQNVAWATRFRPLDAEESALAAKLGKAYASQWGPRFGPVKVSSQ